MSQFDVANAKRALSARLQMWSVDEPAKKADGFIEDLVSQGWVMSPKHEARPRPPHRDEECQMHIGQHRERCAPCLTDRLAVDAAEPVPMVPGATADLVRAGLRKAVG